MLICYAKEGSEWIIPIVYICEEIGVNNSRNIDMQSGVNDLEVINRPLDTPVVAHSFLKRLRSKYSGSFPPLSLA